MEMIHRRRYLKTSAAAGCVLFGQRLKAESELEAARRIRRAAALKVTDIETHEILLPFHDFNAEALFRYQCLAVQLRTIYGVRTNQTDLEGWAENPQRRWSRMSSSLDTRLTHAIRSSVAGRERSRIAVRSQHLGK